MLQETAGGVVLKEKFHLGAQGCVISAGALEISGALSRGRFLQGFEENLPLALDDWINVCLHGLVHKKKRDRPANPAECFSGKIAAAFFAQPGLGESPKPLVIS